MKKIRIVVVVLLLLMLLFLWGINERKQIDVVYQEHDIPLLFYPRLVNVDENGFYIINDYSNTLIIYDVDGIFSKSFDFSGTSGIQLIEATETELLIYKSKANTLYTVNIDGSIISEENVGYNDLSISISNTFEGETYKSSKVFFNYYIENEEEKVFRISDIYSVVSNIFFSLIVSLFLFLILSTTAIIMNDYYLKLSISGDKLIRYRGDRTIDSGYLFNWSGFLFNYRINEVKNKRILIKRELLQTKWKDKIQLITLILLGVNIIVSTMWIYMNGLLLIFFVLVIFYLPIYEFRIYKKKLLNNL